MKKKRKFYILAARKERKEIMGRDAPQKEELNVCDYSVILNKLIPM